MGDIYNYIAVENGGRSLHMVLTLSLSCVCLQFQNTEELSESISSLSCVCRFDQTIHSSVMMWRFGPTKTIICLSTASNESLRMPARVNHRHHPIAWKRNTYTIYMQVQ